MIQYKRLTAYRVLKRN